MRTGPSRRASPTVTTWTVRQSGAPASVGRGAVQTACGRGRRMAWLMGSSSLVGARAQEAAHDATLGDQERDHQGDADDDHVSEHEVPADLELVAADHVE